jgi:hypothetical protein
MHAAPQPDTDSHRDPGERNPDGERSRDARA